VMRVICAIVSAVLYFASFDSGRAALYNVDLFKTEFAAPNTGGIITLNSCLAGGITCFKNYQSAVFQFNPGDSVDFGTLTLPAAVLGLTIVKQLPTILHFFPSPLTLRSRQRRYLGTLEEDHASTPAFAISQLRKIFFSLCQAMRLTFNYCFRCRTFILLRPFLEQSPNCRPG
jgi:hypothetical protein